MPPTDSSASFVGMPPGTQQSQDNIRSASPLVTETYKATMVCHDGPSVTAFQETGINWRLIKLHVEQDPIWREIGGVPLIKSIDHEGYDVIVKKGSVDTDGYTHYSIMDHPRLGSVIQGFSVDFVCDQDPKEWESCLDESGSSRLPGTLRVSLGYTLRETTWLLTHLRSPPSKRPGRHTKRRGHLVSREKLTKRM